MSRITVEWSSITGEITYFEVIFEIVFKINILFQFKYLLFVLFKAFAGYEIAAQTVCCFFSASCCVLRTQCLCRTSFHAECLT
jgi:hypothetical protein